jgi:RNA polymerase sigma factor (sigma-70 family)
MTAGRISTVLDRLRRSALRQQSAELTDGQLLGRFLDRRDEGAFAELVHRHGPMVLGTCRRLAGNAADADDCFQVAFLVLVRQASALRGRDTVGNWLYGVAYHTALKARAQARRRRSKEQTVRDPSPAPPIPQEVWPDVRALLDEELSRLPDKYREAVVLCDLEGKTRKEAARATGVAEGTLSGRLTTARRLLAARLTRRGVTLAGGALAALLARHAAAAVPGRLLEITLDAAIAAGAGWTTATGALPDRVAGLTEGVLRMMRMKKLLTAMLFALSGVGLAGVACWALAAGQTPATGAKPPADALAAKADKKPDDPRLAKVLQAALQDAAAITDPFHRLVAYGYIAKFQARAGQKAAAQATMRKALDAEAAENGADAGGQKDNRLMLLAEFQAETGDSKGAMETAAGISDMSQTHAMGRVASARAKGGDFKGALETIDRSDGVYKDEGLWMIAVAQLKAGDVKGARETAERIGGAWHKAVTLAAIAGARAKAGDAKAAAELLADASAAVPGDGVERTFALAAVAEAMVACGKGAEAVKAAEAAGGDIWGDRARSRIATALADHGDLKAARAVVDMIADEFNRGNALKAVVGALIRAKDLPAAIKEATAAPDIGRCYALLEIAKARAVAGQKSEADQVIQDALKVADGLIDPPNIGGLREAALANAAGAWAAIGEPDAALEWAGKQTDPWVRAMARVRVAEALAKLSAE